MVRPREIELRIESFRNLLVTGKFLSIVSRYCMYLVLVWQQRLYRLAGQRGGFFPFKPAYQHEVRALTDQWKEHGVEESTGYAALTDIIYQTWAGLTAREYKHLKGLRKENLSDNMTNEELVMNMLAELTTTNITKEEHPVTMDEHAQAASRGGSVARVAREAFEQQTGKKVVTDLSMKRYLESQQPQLDFSEGKEAEDE